jgi:hypothetical protein
MPLVSPTRNPAEGKKRENLAGKHGVWAGIPWVWKMAAINTKALILLMNQGFSGSIGGEGGI